MTIPEGYGSVFPYMIVPSADELSGFLKAVFDAEELGRTTFENGRVANVRMRIGTSSFMLGDANPEQVGPMPGTYYVYVDDVDACFARAVEHGAKTIYPPDDMDYGDRQAGIEDPAGNLWWISKRLVDAPYDP